jgi:hypothetical protein
MKFLSSKLADIFADVFCSLLLGTAVCTALFALLHMNVGFGECVLLMLVNLALVVVFTRKWWILPSFLGAAALLGVAVSSLLGTNEEVLSYIGGFFRWCASAYPDTVPYSQNGSMIIVHLAFALPVAAIAFAYFRRLFFFPLLPPAALTLILWAVLTKSDALWPLLITLLFVLFVSIAKMRGNKISHDDSHISSAMLSVSAIILMPVLILLAFAFAPQKDGDWQCKPLVNAVQDLRDYLGNGQGQSPTGGSFNMGLTGFSPLESRLGGDVAVDNKTVLRVKTDTPVRLTGAVFDAYDGLRWYDSFSRQRFRFTSFLWQNKRLDVFEIDKPIGDGRIQELYEGMTKPVELDITGSLWGRTLFAAGHVGSIKSDKPDTADIFFNNQSELFTLQPRRALEYTLSTTVLDRDAEDFDENMLTLEALTAQYADPSWDAVKTQYLQLPESLPESVYEAAEQITDGCGTPYEKALAIESWLSNNCVYTLTPGSPPDGEDFVAAFLQKKQGYCVYFASAMTVLSRCAGLPARYVTGFALKNNPLSDAPDAYIATNATAHAWTEIYFHGIGWVTFDATGWNFEEDAVVSGQNTNSGGYKPPAFTPLPSMDINAGKVQARSGEMPQAIKIMLIVLLCIIAALVLFVTIRFLMLYMGSHGYYLRVCRKYERVGDRLDACYSKVVRQTAFLGISRCPSDTIASWAQRVDEQLGGQTISSVCAPVIRMRFGLEEPTNEEVKHLCAFSDELEKRLRHELGIGGYLWRRILRRRGR